MSLAGLNKIKVSGDGFTRLLYHITSEPFGIPSARERKSSCRRSYFCGVPSIKETGDSLELDPACWINPIITI